MTYWFPLIKQAIGEYTCDFPGILKLSKLNLFII